MWDGEVDRQTFDFVIKRTIENYFSRPSYYKIDGRPVYMLFDVPKRKWLCYDNTPENIEQGFRLAKDYVDAHPRLKAPLIVVNSWNECTEGSYLQPDDLYGYGYLETVKQVFCQED